MLLSGLSTEDTTACSNPFTFDYDVIGENKTLGREIKSELPAPTAPSWLAGQWVGFVSLGKAMRLSLLATFSLLLRFLFKPMPPPFRHPVPSLSFGERSGAGRPRGHFGKPICTSAVFLPLRFWGSRSRSSGKNSEAGVDMCAVTSGTFQNLAGSSIWSSYDSGHFSISETKFS